MDLTPVDAFQRTNCRTRRAMRGPDSVFGLNHLPSSDEPDIARTLPASCGRALRTGNSRQSGSGNAKRSLGGLWTYHSTPASSCTWRCGPKSVSAGVWQCGPRRRLRFPTEFSPPLFPNHARRSLRLACPYSQLQLHEGLRSRRGISRYRSTICRLRAVRHLRILKQEQFSCVRFGRSTEHASSRFS